jgi:hypothetical protein
MPTLKRPLLDDLIIGSSDECWSWDRRPYRNGYVYLPTGRRGGKQLAHRFIVRLIYGDIDTKHVHHICGNKTCGNPAHFQILTKSEHHSLHAQPMKCGHGDEFRRTRKNGKTWCARCQAERNRRWYYERGGREWHKRRNADANH